MTIQFACSCGRKLQAEDEHVGRRVQCPACGAETTVPAGETAIRSEEPTKSIPGPVTAAEPPRPAENATGREEDRPRRRSRERDDDDDRPRRRRSHDRDDDDDDYPDRPVKKTGVGTVLIIVAAVLLVPGCLIALLVPAVQKVREASARIQSQNNLKMMALAMHNYHDFKGQLPEAMPDPNLKGPTQLSWRVELLPYVEQNNLYLQLHHDEPWDSPHNKALLTPMPKVFAHPSHPEENAQGLTYYRVFVGKHTAFPPGKASKIPDNFPDGTSNTILIVEAADPVPWTKPDELEYDPNKPLPKLGGHFGQGTNVALADASTRTLSPNLSERTWRSAIDPADGLPLGPDW